MMRMVIILLKPHRDEHGRFFIGRWALCNDYLYMMDTYEGCDMDFPEFGDHKCECARNLYNEMNLNSRRDYGYFIRREVFEIE